MHYLSFFCKFARYIGVREDNGRPEIALEHWTSERINYSKQAELINKWRSIARRHTYRIISCTAYNSVMHSELFLFTEYLPWRLQDRGSAAGYRGRMTMPFSRISAISVAREWCAFRAFTSLSHNLNCRNCTCSAFTWSVNDKLSSLGIIGYPIRDIRWIFMLR